MIAALQRLRSEQGVPVQMPDTLNAFGINGGLKHGLAGLLMSHPPLEDRIEGAARQRTLIRFHILGQGDHRSPFLCPESHLSMVALTAASQPRNMRVRDFAR